MTLVADYLIAGVCLSRELPLLTRNQAPIQEPGPHSSGRRTSG